jgi:hypothetical protein
MNAGFINGAQLGDVRLACDGKDASVKFSFISGSTLPRFFQAYEKEKGVYSINFLETTTPIPHGNHNVPVDNPYASHITVRETKRKIGNKIRNFLRIEFKVRSLMNKGKYPASKTQANNLTLDLGTSRSEKFHWTLSPSTQPPPLTASPKKDHDALQDEIPGQSGKTDSGISESLKETASDTVKLEELLGTETAFKLGKDIDLNEERQEPISSKTFSIIHGGKILIVLKDGVTSSKKIRILEIGTEVSSLGKEHQWYQIRIESDTGYIRQDLVNYKDELTPQEQSRIDKILAEKRETAKIQAEEQDRKKAERETKKKAEEQNRKNGEIKLKNKAEELATNMSDLEAKKQAEKQSGEKLKKELKRMEEKQRRLEQKRLAEEERLKREKEKVLKLAEKKKKEEKEKREREKERKKVRYNSFGHRDPFIHVKQTPLTNRDIHLDQMKLVGIIWNTSDPLAVLEHRQEPSISIAVRKGDIISNGRVTQITRNKIIFEISEYGVFRFYALTLIPEERIAK